MNAEFTRVRAILKTFHQAELSITSLQPVLELAVRLNPELKGTISPIGDAGRPSDERQNHGCDCDPAVD